MVSSISELHSFMDASDATLARKVLGEGASEQAADDASGAEHDQEEGEAGEERHGRLVRCTCAGDLRGNCHTVTTAVYLVQTLQLLS